MFKFQCPMIVLFVVALLVAAPVAAGDSANITLFSPAPVMQPLYVVPPAYYVPAPVYRVPGPVVAPSPAIVAGPPYYVPVRPCHPRWYHDHWFDLKLPGLHLGIGR